MGATAADRQADRQQGLGGSHRAGGADRSDEGGRDDDAGRRNPGAPDLAADHAVTRTAAETSHVKAAVGTQEPPLGGAEDLTNRGVDRSVVIGRGVDAVSRWSLRATIIVIAAAGLLWLLGRVWVGVFPLILALLLTTVLWPPTEWLRRRGAPAALAAAAVLLGSLAVIVGILAAITPSLVGQSSELASAAGSGLGDLQERLAAPPFNVDSATLDDLVAQGQGWLQDRAGDIASGVFSGVSLLGNALVTLALVLVLTFFFLKDGPNFLPFLRRTVGRTAGRHLTEVSVRSWNTLGGFIRTQAIVSAVDAVLIGAGLLILQVPLAFALAILTFFGGFIPIVGAFAVGALAVLVALVSQGLTTALIVLAIIIAVQQIEGNVLQPFLQGKSMNLHAGVILLAVAAGSTLFGVAGAFLAVPAAATIAVVMRYLSEQVDLRTGDLQAADVRVATKDGEVSAQQGELAADDYAEDSDTRTMAQERTEHRDLHESGLSGRVRAAVGAARDGWRRPRG